MKLITAEIAKKLPPIGSTENVEDPEIIVKFFDPCGSWSWYVTEGDLETGELFGLVDGHEKELGYFSLADIQEFRGRLGLGIKRDMHFGPARLSQVRSGEVR